MNPADPETLLVATWERQRDEFDSHPRRAAVADGYDAYDPVKKWGAGGGIYKTTDGGKTFKKLTKGLPTATLGRIGLDFYRKDPKVVFAIIDCEKIGMGTPLGGLPRRLSADDAEGGAKLTEVTADSPAAKAGLKAGDVVTAVDRQADQELRATSATRCRDHKPGDKVKLDGPAATRTMDVAVTLGKRPGAGGRRRRPPRRHRATTSEDGAARRHGRRRTARPTRPASRTAT